MSDGAWLGREAVQFFSKNPRSIAGHLRGIAEGEPPYPSGQGGAVKAQYSGRGDALTWASCMLKGPTWAPCCSQAPLNAHRPLTGLHSATSCSPLRGTQFTNHPSRVASCTIKGAAFPHPLCLVLPGTFARHIIIYFKTLHHLETPKCSTNTLPAATRRGRSTTRADEGNLSMPVQYSAAVSLTSIY